MRFDRVGIGILILAVTLMIIPDIADVDAKGQIFLIQHEGKEYQVTYLISGTGGGVVKDIAAEDLSIKTTIQSDMDAHLVLIIPKELLKATHISFYTDESAQGIFVDGRVPGIFVDGRSIENYTARSSQNVIMFRIPFEAGAEKIEIVGSAVPEFDGFVFAILGPAMAAILIVTVRYRSRLRIWRCSIGRKADD